MPATDKAALMAVTEKEFAKLWATLEGVDAALATAPHPEDGITIKDTVLHRVHWIDLFLGWYRDGVAGKDVQTPAPGYKWNQLKEYNAKLREATRDVPWAEALAQLEAGHKALLALLGGLDEDALYGAKRYDWQNDWTIGRWAEASGASHYRSANKYIRQIKKLRG